MEGEEKKEKEEKEEQEEESAAGRTEFCRLAVKPRTGSQPTGHQPLRLPTSSVQRSRLSRWLNGSSLSYWLIVAGWLFFWLAAAEGGCLSSFGTVSEATSNNGISEVLKSLRQKTREERK